MCVCVCVCVCVCGGGGGGGKTLCPGAFKFLIRAWIQCIVRKVQSKPCCIRLLNQPVAEIRALGFKTPTMSILSIAVDVLT